MSRRTYHIIALFLAMLIGSAQAVASICVCMDAAHIKGHCGEVEISQSDDLPCHEKASQNEEMNCSCDNDVNGLVSSQVDKHFKSNHFDNLTLLVPTLMVFSELLVHNCPRTSAQLSPPGLSRPFFILFQSYLV